MQAWPLIWLVSTVTIIIVTYRWVVIYHADWRKQVTDGLKQNRLLVVLLIVIGAVLLVAVSGQAQDDIAESRFADALDVPLDVSGTVKLHIVYPKTLRLDPLGKQGRPLTVWLTPTVAISPSQSYTVTFTHADSLWFTDESTHAVPAQLILPTDLVSHTVGTLWMRPAPLITAPVTVPLGIVVSGKTLETLTIGIESEGESRLRFVFTHLVRDATVPISVLGLIITGLALLNTYRKQQREQEDKDRREFVTAVREALDNNRADALLLFIQLGMRVRSERWDNSAEREWQTLLRTHRGQLVRELGKTFVVGSSTAGLKNSLLCVLTASFAPARSVQSPEAAPENKLADWLEVIQKIDSAHTFRDLPPCEHITSAIGGLWDPFNEDALDLVVEMIVTTWKHVKEDERKANEDDENKREAKKDYREDIVHALEYQSNRLRLFYEPRLKAHEIRSNKAQLFYEWSSLKPVTCLTDEQPMASWIEARGWLCNPFGHGIAEADTLLLDTWLDPEKWSDILAPRHTVIVSRYLQDRAATIIGLRDTLQKSNKSFAVYLPLPSSAIQPDAAHLDYLKAIAHASGETWIPLLARCPSALLALPKHEQAVVADFLAWSAGSGDCLPLRLQQNQLADDAEGQMVLRKLAEAIDEKRQSTDPTEGQLMTWLGIRPSELKHTHLITDCVLPDMRAPYQVQIKSLFEMSTRLTGAGVVLKAFTPALPLRLPSHIHSVPLVWSRDALKGILGRRMSKSALGYDNFRDFFMLPGLVLGLTDPDDQLADAANGSLSRMLALANDIVRASVARDPDSLILDEAVLDKILQDRGGTA